MVVRVPAAEAAAVVLAVLPTGLASLGPAAPALLPQAVKAREPSSKSPASKPFFLSIIPLLSAHCFASQGLVRDRVTWTFPGQKACSSWSLVTPGILPSRVKSQVFWS